MIFEWVVTDAPHPAMVGVGSLTPDRMSTHRTTRLALQVAASLPGSFTVEDDTGAVLVRGKCSDVKCDIMKWEHGGPLRMTRTFYSASRVVYKLGEAQMGIYI